MKQNSHLMQEQKTKKVLVIRLSSLGDIIHSTAVIPVLEQANCEIHYVVKPTFVSLIQNCQPTIKVYSYDVSVHGSEFQARKAFFAWAQEQKFDCIIDLHDSLRTKFWRYWLHKIAPVYVARKPRLQEFWFYLLRQKSWGLGRGGRAKRMRAVAVQAIVERFGVHFSSEKSDSLTCLKAPILRDEIEQRIPKKDYLVIVPGSAWPGKRWPVDKFKELLVFWRENAPIVILGGKMEEDYSCLLKIAQEFSPESISFQGETTLEDCAAIISRAKLVVGNDTGLIHMAEALGKNVVAMEGPTHPVLGYSIYRKNSRIVHSEVVCSPCSKNGRICWRWGSRACMQNISSAEVVQTVLDTWNV